MRYFYIALTLLLVSSCGLRKGVRYFEDIDKGKVISESNFPEVTYKAHDLVKIRVTSPTNIGVEPFNLTETSFINEDGVGVSSESSRPYLISQRGTIDFPVIGEVSMVGKTREEATLYIENLITPYITDPRVEIELVSFRISVVGDVGSPGVYEIDNERVTIIEAIALAGDLNLSGKRTDIHVLREEDGSKKFIKVNMLDSSLFTSPAYYLKQNDVVYVEQNKLKTREAGWESRLPLYTSVVALTLTLYSFFLK